MMNFGCWSQNERPELERRRLACRGKHDPLEVWGKTVVIVDDGAATGTPMKVAIRALKRRSPREIVLALPVAPPETLTDLAGEADWTVCLSEPTHLRAIGQITSSFPSSRTTTSSPSVTRPHPASKPVDAVTQPEPATVLRISM